MLIVGLVGGIASGKSYVAKCFEDLGSATVHADQLGHLVLRDPNVIQQLVQQFGREILDPDGSVSRRRLGHRVFSNQKSGAAKELESLEAITHPEIERLMRQQLVEFRQAGYDIVMLDAAVLFRAHWESICNRILFVECQQSTRVQRAIERGWTQQEFFDREANQLPIVEKRQHATDFVFNDADARDPVNVQAARLWGFWQKNVLGFAQSMKASVGFPTDP
ncbi:MAG: dephospho-CoA kinase [Pirellulaceae bacterium]